MGHDKPDHKDVQEGKREHVEAKLGEKFEAHGKEAFADLQSEKTNKFVDGKIDKVEKVLGQPVTAAEKTAMKELGHAIASGDMKEVGKVLEELSHQKPPVDMKRVAMGLDSALQKSGVRVVYDGNSDDDEGMRPHLRIETGPKNDDRSSSGYGAPKLDSPDNKAVMIPTDGGTPQVGRGDSYYTRSTPQVNKDASADDLKGACKEIKTSQAEDEKKKEVAGLK